MKRSFIIFLLCLALSPFCFGQDEMKGVSSNGMHPDQPYLTAGDRTYLIGTQDGNFPNMGGHVKDEMGGLWMHPIKLIDGFWLGVYEKGQLSGEFLNKASEFVSYPYGSEFIYKPIMDGIHISRLQFSPQGKEGLIMRYTFTNPSDRDRSLKLEFTVQTDLSPVWFSKENNIVDGEDLLTWDKQKSACMAQDKNNPWFVTWSTSIPATKFSKKAPIPIPVVGQGKSARTTHPLELRAGETKTFVVAFGGSTQDKETAWNNCQQLLSQHAELLQAKKAHYEAIIARASIDIPDKKLQQAYSWGKINSEWLACDMQGLGRFLGAGAIEYPWLFGCDNSYATQGLVASGDPELAKSTLRMIKQVSERTNGNGRIIHEMSSNGFVYNKGNTQETAHFAVAVWKVFEWTGDMDFLREMYPYIKKGINWLFTDQDTNGNLFPEGYGIMEVRGLNAELIDVAVYAQQDLEVTARMAALLNEPELQRAYAEKAAVLKEKINTYFWDEASGTYTDFYGSREQAVTTMKGAIEQLYVDDKDDTAYLTEMRPRYDKMLADFEHYPAGTQKGWLTNKNWVISTPVEVGIAPRDRAIRLLDTVRMSHCGPYGPYLSAVEKRRMMTISTGVQAMAEASMGRTDEAMWYVDKIAETFSRILPGSISEMMPDYGCPVQAWTIYGLACPLVSHVFGIGPDAYHKAVSIHPHLPSQWNRLSIKNLPVGNNSINLSICKEKGSTEYHLISVEDSWTFTLQIDGLNNKSYQLNGKPMLADSDNIVVTGKDTKIVIKE